MHIDVLDLRQFYYRTRLGRAAQKAVRDRLVAMWPEAKGQTVVGFGFAVPLLRPYLADARRVIGLMPAPQGVMHWPAGMANVSLLSEETLWPLETGAVDKLVLLHALEASDNPQALLEECCRVLGPGGRAVFIVPNRTGLWARRDRTPFGFGRPYSRGQLEAQVKRAGLVPERHAAALFAPPSGGKFWLRVGGFMERLGQRLSRSGGGGVILLEVSKQVPARPRTGLAERVRRPLRVLEGVPEPLAAGRIEGGDM
ncbi:class I SAM-dependent methyltransferase [Jannaschia rubra]|uniref:Methyltransferase domain protein n=1 Tax=Jannaschia rubra TaxID=282197 RepID=A0A0M6XMN4_9RHOB|nr:methyltransferase domain-containing protein [Jannaschia rubra]CTQ31471.1 Methyltransferase domain protein [Jannaschia rubra]SFF78787.1 Methyltransferase domain-containing protein [Jannaschia rubra]